MVLNKSDHIKKVTEHIQTDPYEEMRKPVDTMMNKVKKSTAEPVRKMKPSLGESKWFNLMPKTNNASRIYGTIKIHKPGHPIRPIVDLRNTPNYELSKHLALIFCPLRNRSNSRLTNSYEMKNKINDIQQAKDETMVSFDITSLYTNIPVNMALEAVKKELTEDPELNHRTKLPIEQIILGIHLCLTSTIFKFRGKIN
uniref:Reverse transcriptase domain-containing protein n=1 Tax=Trichobilharzia regenti TaxID=157069 RepID=A0AA85J0X3_TRIRE|nr:unnamed protein product [Trichobilharzia regenti]